MVRVHPLGRFAETVNTPAPTTAQRALEDIREGRWTSALRNADLALAEGSTDAWLPRLRGVALTNLGRVEEAAAILETVADGDPSPVILHELAAARLAGDDLPGARRAVNRAVAVDAVAPHTRRAAALLSMRSGDWRSAESELRAVVLEDQFDVEALNNLAICLVRQGRMSEAVQYMSHARSRGQATRHWRLLDHNHALVAPLHRPGDDDPAAGPESPSTASAPAAPRSMSAAILRARYEGHKNPPVRRPDRMAAGFQRVMVGFLLLVVLVTMVGATIKQPPLGMVFAIIVAVAVAFWWRTRRAHVLTVLPTSARLRVPPKRDDGVIQLRGSAPPS